MGWNSFDCFGLTVTENEIREHADFMARHLAEFGWRYLVIDGNWFGTSDAHHGNSDGSTITMDEQGCFIPDPRRFPSSQGGRGFRPLADYIHSLGLKLGIHIYRGVPRAAVDKGMAGPIDGTTLSEIADLTSTCEWHDFTYGLRVGHPKAAAYYDHIVAMYASWGVDFLKADDLAFPYREWEIEAVSAAVEKCGREMVLSLSPGIAARERRDHLQSHSHMWRISADFWDRWDDLKRQFELCRPWFDAIGKPGWPDADMLPIGRLCVRQDPVHPPERLSRFTHDELRTLMTLWALFRSPLMIGGVLPGMDAFSLSLLTNRAVLRVNQYSMNNRIVRQDEHSAVWTAEDSEKAETYVGFFNLDDAPAILSADWKALGLTGSFAVRDLWSGEEFGTADSLLKFEVAPHGAHFVALSNK